jgi:hypothetical protein
MQRSDMAFTLGSPQTVGRNMRRLAGLWCTLMHDSLMWPIHGEYECRTCGHRQPIPWEQPSYRPNATKVVPACLTQLVS